MQALGGVWAMPLKAEVGSAVDMGGICLGA